jgi:hypothetical protein
MESRKRGRRRPPAGSCPVVLAPWSVVRRILPEGCRSQARENRGIIPDLQLSQRDQHGTPSSRPLSPDRRFSCSLLRPCRSQHKADYSRHPVSLRSDRAPVNAGRPRCQTLVIARRPAADICTGVKSGRHDPCFAEEEPWNVTSSEESRRRLIRQTDFSRPPKVVIKACALSPLSRSKRRSSVGAKGFCINC